MSDSESVFRIHPAIGIARVGNSEDYVISPETLAGMPVEGQGPTTGGLPIRPGTETETVTSRELRDRELLLRMVAELAGDEAAIANEKEQAKAADGWAQSSALTAEWR